VAKRRAAALALSGTDETSGAKMAVSLQARNPSWSRDELILALDLYVRFKGNPPGKSNADVSELSELLNQMSAHMAHDAAKFRNPNGVYMKVMNFRRFDPQYTEQGKKGLQRGGKLELEVWNDFAGKAVELSEVVKSIRLALSEGTVPVASEEEDEEVAEADEGRILTRIHRARERNRELVARKKAAVLEIHGTLECEVCSFDFQQTYGSRGAGFMEVHHLKPLSTLHPGDKTTLDDLALVCANCHRMVHARRPWLSMEQLETLIRASHENVRVS
jgi:5-methylcytosine-specific restriction enzyme A